MKILINFYANVSEHSANSLINYITQQIASQKTENLIDEIVIQVASSGGSSDHGLLIFNYLRQLSIPITTIGMGNVDSAAVMIFCAGKKRIAMKSCRILLHEALTNIQGSFNAVKLHEIAYMNERITHDYSSVIADVTDKDIAEFVEQVREGKVLSSVEAKNFDLVTDISDAPYLSNLDNLQILMINNPPVAGNQVQHNQVSN